MIGFIKKLFGSKPAEANAAPEVPYKVETPVAPTPVAEKATEAVVTSIAKPAKKPAPKKAPRKPKSKPQA